MLPTRGALRRFRLGLPTILGAKPRGFFIPYRYAGELSRPSPRGTYSEIESLFRRRHATFLSILEDIESHAGALVAFRGEPAGAPRWTQDWFPRLDGAAAYAIVRARKPRRIVEIGSGHSTRFLARAVADEGIECRITAVDPAPRAALRGLDGIDHLSVTLQKLMASHPTTSPVEELSPGDILFVDSSHIAMPGSDVDLVLNRLFPRLPPGVLIHFHDVFLPDDYPPEWEWRGYNEQLAIAPLLTGGGCDVLFASRYVSTRLSAALDCGLVSRLPIPPGAFESSLWLVKRTEPSVQA